MASFDNHLRFWLPVLVLAGFTGYTTYHLVQAHLAVPESEPTYDFVKEIPPVRGAIYDSTRDVHGRPYPFVKAIPCWEYRLDPVALTAAVVKVRGEKPRSQAAIAASIARELHLDRKQVLEMCRNYRKRYQYLGVSFDIATHDRLMNRSYVAGVIDRNIFRRINLEGRHLSHVLGAVNAERSGVAGIELQFNRQLRGIPGCIRGKRDGRGREIGELRVEQTPAVNGADVYLTVDHNIQKEVEKALAEGVVRYGAASGWAIVLDSATAKVLAMASYPDFHPQEYGKVTDFERLNRATGFTYEPGSVMKVITAAGAIDAGFVRPDSTFNTDRNEAGYYRLPGDGSHRWEPRMTLRDAIVHSSNIVIGKLGYDFGPERLYDTFRRFGFGEPTGIELPGEESGILRNPRRRRWDKATQSRAAIGQALSVTAIQLVSAYQAIANDGMRIAPRIVERVVNADGRNLLDRPAPEARRVVSAATARKVREMMLDVASPKGTARRAALRGYSVAGKTGTAQKVVGGRYAPGLYRASFCGIVPSGVVRRQNEDAHCVPPKLVILVTLDFDANRRYHQGGNSSGPVFKQIAQNVLYYLNVEPDRPDELLDIDETSADADDQPENDGVWDGDLNWMFE